MPYEVFSFEVVPYGLPDLLEGRYIKLKYSNLGLAATDLKKEELKYVFPTFSKQAAYITLKQEGELTRLSKIYFDKKDLPDNVSFITTKDHYIHTTPEEFTVSRGNFWNKLKEPVFFAVENLPVTRYCMKKRLSPEAEKLLASSGFKNEDKEIKAVLYLRVYKNGQVAADKLIVGDKTIEEFVEHTLKKQ